MMIQLLDYFFQFAPSLCRGGRGGGLGAVTLRLKKKKQAKSAKSLREREATWFTFLVCILFCYFVLKNQNSKEAHTIFYQKLPNLSPC